MQANVDSISDSAVEPQRVRLPVNPRRVKVAPAERKRVVRACNACNVRRVRCSGDQPCQRCRRTTRQCEYPAPESDKGALKNEVDRLRRRCAELEKAIQSSSATDGATDSSGQKSRNQSTASSSAFQGSDAGDDINGRMLRDPDGTFRYHGETSGATFLDHLKDFMLTMVPINLCVDPAAPGSTFCDTLGLYQTFDSRPLANPEVDPSWLPHDADQTRMLARLRHYLQDGNGDVPSGGIYWWGNLNALPSRGHLSSASLIAMTNEPNRDDLAFKNVCFALVSCVDQPSLRLSDEHSGEACFRRARILIGNPFDTVRFSLDDVPVLTLMAFYLIEINRRDTAFMYVGVAVRIANIYGAFKSTNNEKFRRVLWTLYVVDRWLSVLMGRSPAIAEEAIKIPLPSDDDHMPPCQGLRAHVELSRISNYIVCETFNIESRDCKPGQSSNKVDNALKMLRTWELLLPSALQLPADLNDNDPFCYMLHMAHNQLVVLTTRPIFFAAVKQAVAQRVVHGRYPQPQDLQTPHMHACLAAACRNLRLAEYLVQSGRKMLQAGLHFIFNAAVILLLNRLMRSKPRIEPGDLDIHSTPMTPEEERIESSIQFAIEVFQAESRTGTHYPRDCSQLLQGLNALTSRNLAWQKEAYSQQQMQHTDLGVAESDCVGASRLNLLGEDSAIYAEMMNWEQCNGLQLSDSLFI
ncbi:hypothetical protein DE146DRAFT_607868 [Phaeosphaeria sp. MPI-PUGE-AT-0046c]|nr:hypothetical protein DE146DRAFT_607868 [Phaeosphaeria sp. MPI-PUGE-AT-0046c]